MTNRSGQMACKWIKIVCLVVVSVWSGIVFGRNDVCPSSSDEHVDVWYVSVRDVDAQGPAGNAYGGLRGETRMGICSMTIAQIPGLEEIAASAPFYIPDERMQLNRVSETSHKRFWEEIDAFARNNTGKIVFYTHGYNVGFEKSCRRASILQRGLNAQDRLLLFSWPADGNLLSYTRDEADLVWSVPQLAALLEKLARAVGPERLDVVAHSLGTRGVVLALSRIICEPVMPPLINELVLVAPDIDTDYFLDAWPRIRPLVRHTTLYASEHDSALRASREAHGYPRLGEGGEHLTVLAGIETIDVTPAGKRRVSGHIYHLYHPWVAADLQTLLNTGQPADGRANLLRTAHQGQTYWRLEPKDQ